MIDFRTDNIADVLGILLALILLVIAWQFRGKMKDSHATAWEEMGTDLIHTAVLFLLGMIVTFSAVFAYTDIDRMWINLAGNVFWVFSAYFAYKLITRLISTLEAVFGE